MPLTSITPANVDETGFFCCMSKKNSPGYQRKLVWLQERFTEGLKIKLLPMPERGFIEYIPGEFAWRTVNADGYMFIHCLWVVGKSKGKGFGRYLLQACENDARKLGMAGVAVVASRANWSTSEKIFLENGFQTVEKAKPAFSLMVKKFRDAPNPSFIPKIENRVSQYQDGFTVFLSGQCPYLDDAVASVEAIAKAGNEKCTLITLQTAAEVRALSPTAYGVFDIIYHGREISYHYLYQKDILSRIDK